MALLPVATYGLQVPPGDEIVPAIADFPATFRITMAAIDPSEPADSEAAEGAKPRATLKLIRQPEGTENDQDSKEYMRALLADSDSEDESESEEEANGGPSDPAKSKKARKATALQQLMDTLDSADEEMEDAPNTNGKASKKGKAKATSVEEAEDSEDSSDDEEDIEIEEFVLCTLDPEKNLQQPLDITIGENERVFFKVTGTHSIYLTGNYVIPQDNGHNHHHEVYDSEDEDNEYDLSPDEDELELELDDDESDDLDALENPRITEVDSDDEAPKLVSGAEKKGKNKRSADQIEESASLDDIMAKTLKPEAAEEQKLSKKQLKKLKKNNGEAAPAKAEESKKTDSAAMKSESADKKVQFAKNLVQGPTGSAEKTKVAVDNTDTKGKAELGVKLVKGVKIDDKKLGTGPACKKGNKVGMRYIGKLENGKVFDSNTKGKPFSFKLGSGEVIRGWDIGVAGMSVGGERRLTIPASLAYGSKGAGQIPGNATLVFDLKLLEIK
ncbi:FKBP-type peptidyl-prolyl cis-trans isomerase [Diplocarpon rosae]|nr:FKBP-type peptidyl-prolyl cis-trans isomerase [Diplocarpon rosae]